MKIYAARPSEGTELCLPTNSDDFESIVTLIDGTKRRRAWSPMRMRLIGEDEGKHLSKSDSPWLGAHALIFRQGAVEALLPLLIKYGELLPLACAEAPLWMYNPTYVLDALDERVSSVDRFSSGRIMMIRKHAFLPEMIHDAELFKLSCMRASDTFVQQGFVDLWNASCLRGLDFELIWEGT